jgi:hypothetical protein
VVFAMLVYDGSILRIHALFKYDDPTETPAAGGGSQKVEEEERHHEIFPIELETTTSNKSDNN